MTKITLKGNTINTSGSLPSIGSSAKDFELIAGDLSTKTLRDFKGQNLVLNIFPSIDTGTCAASVRNFNKAAAELNNTVVLCISRDLPFAQKRFCGAEGIEKVVMLSDFKTGQFGKNYGLDLIDGPLAGLNSRSVVIINADGKVIYTEQVAETTEEPNYEAALKSL
ncbi:MAG: thiol peroxidase [Flavobacteriales bacterium]|nr:thiol peroxidase [Flavobacteriales bacterium]